jgi:glycerol-3-phosphate acyltransferase PlsX
MLNNTPNQCSVTLAVDAMGGDLGPSLTVPAVLSCAAENADTQFILVGKREILQGFVDLDALPSNISFQPANDVIRMDESVASALRAKKDSSMRVALNLVKEGRASACVSAGNTGALMATARFVLKTLNGVDRPAIVATLPSEKSGKQTHMLDLGANVNSTSEHLVQFAVMGSVLAACFDGIKKPRIALLNIGEEDMKGNELVKATAEELINTPMLNYTGYVEGSDLFKDKADVIVCDGFAGNVALKSCEGALQLIFFLAKKAFHRTLMTKLMGFLVKPIFRQLRQMIDPANYNGAILVGLQGIVVKSHGNTTQRGFINALLSAKKAAEQKVTEQISVRIEALLSARKEHKESDAS